MTEERVCEYEDGAIEIIQFQKQKEKKIDEKQKGILGTCGMVSKSLSKKKKRKSNIYVIGVSEKEKKRWVQKKYLRR